MQLMCSQCVQKSDNSNRNFRTIIVFKSSLLESYYSLMLSSKRNLIVINGSGLGETLGIKMSRFIPL